MEPLLSSVDGPWIGSFDFGDARLPTQIEVNVVVGEDKRAITGWTSDPGPAGKAQIEGRQDGRRVSFTAFYVAPKTGERVAAVDYEGILSEDLDSINGKWTTRPGSIKTESGSWRIYRANSDRAVSGDKSWPPSADKLPKDSLLKANAYIEAMTAKVFDGRLTLTKPAPSAGAKSAGQTPAAIAFGLSIVVLILAIADGFALITEGPNKARIVALVLTLAASIGLGALVYRWFLVYRVAVAFVLDRKADTITRNTKLIGSFSQIGHIEVNTDRASRDSGIVIIVMKDGKRILIESGRLKDALALSNDIGQFVGVEVIAIT